MTSESQKPFWLRKSLEELDEEEWESLCDGCARCCIHRVEDDETGEVFETMVSCRLLDTQACRCTSYSDRHQKVPGCLVLTPKTVRLFDWLPNTCAYRRVAKGKDLPEWHPLKTGDPESVHEAGISVRGKALSEELLGTDDLTDFIIERDDD
jgi:uncharacterized cysteine cluster protein YcgN (CxxCxxCC family)